MKKNESMKINVSIHDEDQAHFCNVYVYLKTIEE